MEPISINEFVKDFVAKNKDINESDLRKKLNQVVSAKQSGATCMVCGQPIWAIGTAIVDWNGCYPCITGESDSSEDYEIDSVCNG